ncbi:MAG: hypothetical protein BroJett020_02290 [Bacteroidota bacterium]|nr:MAG: hypothetical protein BroJett020_02290 [Bacteroidota bacterium]
MGADGNGRKDDLPTRKRLYGHIDKIFVSNENNWTQINSNKTIRFIHNLNGKIVKDMIVADGSSGNVAYFVSDVISTNDVYPFGSLLPQRNFSSEKYRYGFGGMEMDNEVNSITGTVYTTSWRGYDSRLGRWFSVDPMTKALPSESPYNYANNTPIIGSDPDGDFCVPCIALLLGALTYPTIAANPTGNAQQDAQSIANAKEIQAKWVVYTLFSAGLGSGVITAEAFLGEVSAQYGTQVAFEAFKDYDSNGKINLENVLFQAAKNIDLFDATFGKFSGVGVLDNILTAGIDITPEEAQILGVNKDISSVTLDFVLNTVSGDSKAPKGKYSSILKKTQDKAQEVAGEQLKDIYQVEKNYQVGKESAKTGVRDNTNVSNNKPAHIKELDNKSEDQ